MTSGLKTDRRIFPKINERHAVHSFTAILRPVCRTLCNRLAHVSSAHYIGFHSIYCRQRSNIRNVRIINVLTGQFSIGQQLKLVKPGSAGSARMFSSWADFDMLTMGTAESRIIPERSCCNRGFVATIGREAIQERPAKRARCSVSRHTVSSRRLFFTAPGVCAISH